MKKAVLIGLALTALVASPAVAADLSRPAPPAYKAPPPPPVFSWTGFYLGGNLGGAWAQHTVTDSFFGVTFDTGTSNGVFIGGGQVGFNYEFGGGFVLGVEGEFEGIGSNNHNNVGVVVPALTDTIAITSNNRWLATVAARFGWAFNNWLVYGKAGGGWVSTNGFTVTDLTTGESISSSGNTASGWLAGAGFEWAFFNNWTLKLEYDYLGVNNRTFVVPAVATATPFDLAFVGDTFSGHRNVQMVKVGFNYLFNWGGPVRY
jgi:outer membrane immunogenic protein